MRSAGSRAMTSPPSSGALEAVERILNRGGEPHEVLRQVVDVMHERTGAWVAIAFDSEPGPSAGQKPDDHQRHQIFWQGRAVAELWSSRDADPAVCARVAVIVSPYCHG
jgi:hypothetical protein